MRIDSYSSGRIVIDGVVYTSDVILAEGKVDSSWWRKEGHRLDPEDLETVLRAKPDILIIGIGHSGALKVPSETQQFLRTKGIEFKILRTGEACKTFNEIVGTRSVAAALHLTC